MDWRRGLLLAAINVAVAVPMILMMEHRDSESALVSEEIMAKAPMKDPPGPPKAATPGYSQATPEKPGETVSFDLWAMWADPPVQVVVLQGGDMLPVVLAGWEYDCPAPWSLAGRLRGRWTWPPTPFWMETQRKIDAGLCLFIAVQWFLVGAFPLARTRNWWADPGAFITACTVLAGAIAMIPVVGGAARLPALFAMLAWFWWLGFVIWKALQLAWRTVTLRRAHGPA